MKSLHRPLAILLCLLGWAGLRPAATAADTAAVAPSSSTYTAAGGTLSLAVTLDYNSTVTGLGFGFTQPAGWKFVSVSGTDVPPVAPNAGDTGELDFAYITAPASSASFTVVISYPAGLSGTQTLSSVYAIFRPDQSQAVPQASLSVTAAGGGTTTPIPTITAQPSPVTVAAGGTANFAVTATSSTGGALAYQWLFNGAVISGQTGASLTLTNVQTADAGSYSVAVTAVGGTSTTSSAAALAVTAVTGPATAHLVNLSTRALGSAAAPVVEGLVIGGSGSKSVLARGIGPSLASFSIAGPMPDPQLTLFSQAGAQLGFNDDWGGGAGLAAIFTQTGAFALPVASKDSALVQTLAGGSYSASVTPGGGVGGIVLVEAYDADTAAIPTARFVNLSTLGFSGTGASILTTGFSVSGTGTEMLLIRGIGPSLAGFSVAGAMTDPVITVFDANSNVIASNDNWGGTAALTAAFAATGAFSLPTGSKDAALIMPFAAGNYTVQITGVGGTTGIALIELYELPSS